LIRKQIRVRTNPKRLRSLRTPTNLTAPPCPSLLLAQGKFRKISGIQSESGIRRRDSRNLISRTGNVLFAKKIKQLTRQTDTTLTGMLMAGGPTMRITLKYAKMVATQIYTSREDPEELNEW
jgi:hypothetical protein